MGKYECLVCGYANMDHQPRDHAICPCCGTQFALDDVERTLEQLREEWILKGTPWFDDATPIPPHWDGMKQLADAELLPATAKVSSVATSTATKIILTKRYKPYMVVATATP